MALPAIAAGLRYTSAKVEQTTDPEVNRITVWAVYRHNLSVFTNFFTTTYGLADDPLDAGEELLTAGNEWATDMSGV